MKEYLLKDELDNVFPLIKIRAKNKNEALVKAINGILENEILDVDVLCETLGIELIEISTIQTYE